MGGGEEGFDCEGLGGGVGLGEGGAFGLGGVRFVQMKMGDGVPVW